MRKLESKKKEVFIEKLLEWNKIHNLTGAKTKEEIEKNIIDSLYPLNFLKKDIKTALDIGTGAGFPGLILAMAMPDTKWFLVEPRNKRAAFLNYIKTILNLKNIQILKKRIEEIKPFKVDLITSRAVMKTKDLLNLVKDFIKEDTTIIFYKGENVENEIKNLKCKIVEFEKRKYLIIKGKDVI
ncbi:16S rRNA (guanine(527)-N(7))-methyltransferase RsmG [Nitrosophilus kaiyonis]|uniref:16S rRNA (guanine(527)-N(7))-methyltransferase RsmG n=1 Tax=Nitrosophilus kaiyonis TaxID=2930200 RepID=UPI002490A51C|nr:16S rRNA (guanine(527)-N(7))-methyltransferase RsmG [Nitrosophilus kaiyonis]